jgi:hypothetical protein
MQFLLNSNSDKSGIPSRILYPAVVTDISDPNGQRRIRAEIKELSDGQLSEIPWCDSLHDGNIPVNIGEAVYVLLSDPAYPYSDRVWISRRISTLESVNYETYDSAMRGTVHSRKTAPKPLPTYDKEYDDRIIYGKGDSEIKFGTDDLQLSANLRDRNNKSKYNRSNARVRLGKLKNNLNNTVAFQGDNIILASYLNTIKPNSDMSDKSLELLFAELYSIPRGEILVKILSIFKEAIMGHTHKYHLVVPDPTNPTIEKLKNTLFNELNNNHIKIN